jgi:3-dehydroquinate synthase
MRPIVISESLLDPAFIQRCLDYKTAIAIITDTNVGHLYGEKLAQKLGAHLFSFQSCEENKTRRTKELLEDQMLEKKLGRDTLVIGMGGGIVTDMAGFIASTYSRGVPLILVPTTLLAMADAAIGGKTGVNTSHGKNLIGTFYQPDEIFMPLETLHSLPKREIRNGMVEMIKHALIADRDYFNFLKESFQRQNLRKAIKKSYTIKQSIVSQDEKESGKRRLLNFGHTVGHALEKVLNYQISHGLAVAIGILSESYMAMQLKLLPERAFEEVFHLFQKLEIRFDFSPLEVMKAMEMDKKSLKNQPRFVLLSNIGAPLSFDGEYCRPVDAKIIESSLQWVVDALNCDHRALV